MDDSWSLKDWLELTGTDSKSIQGFVINHIKESHDSDQRTKDSLGDVLVSAWTDPDLLIDHCKKDLKWIKTAEFISSLKTNRDEAKRGEFGEALMYNILEEFYGFEVPVRKLRFKILASDSLHGTDIIAVKTNGTSLVEVSFTECKLRTAYDAMAGIEAFDQLVEGQNKSFPEMIHFTALRLKESGSRIYGSFKSYMHNRSNPDQIESFRVSLIYDNEAWSDVVLTHLKDDAKGALLGSTYIDVISISRLRSLVDEIYNSLGVKPVGD